MDKVYVASSVRTPVGKAGRGSLIHVRPDDLAAVVLREAVTRAGVAPEAIRDAVMGCAFPEGEAGFNLARIAVFRAGLPETIPAATLNRLCSSGLESMATVAAKIETGMYNLALAGGAESMSMIPLGGLKLAPNPWLTVEHPEVYCTMGNCGDNMARDFGITREEADRWALRSHERALAAIQAGRFKEEIVPVEAPTSSGMVLIDTDEGPRADTTLEALSKLRPAFAASPRLGVCTAGNASQTSDGAAAVVLAHERLVEEQGLKPLARFRGYSVHGGAPQHLGPPQVTAIREACAQAGIAVEDVELFEINEAFATVALYVMRELNLDPEKVNVNGGAIALGHPLGCTGARLTATLLHEMKRRGLRWGVVTMCIGGGMGAAGVFERIDG